MCGLVRTPTSYIGVKLPGVLIPGFTLNKMALFSKFLIFFTRNVVRGALRRCAHTESGKCLVNNVNLHYEKVGNSSQVLLCLPGAMGSTHTDFAPQLDGLKENFTVVCFDPRGYGKSIPPKRDFPLDFYHRDADDAAELMEKLGKVLIN